MNVKPLKRSSVEASRRSAALTFQRFNTSTILIASRQRARKINRRLLKQIATGLLADLKIEKADLGIQLVAAPEMTRLNEKFLQHAGPTDVITFDYCDKTIGADVRRLLNQKPALQKRRRETPYVVSYKNIHGEIFVCVDEAVLQARKFGTSWQSEVARYIVHGVLHLLGFGDSSANARRKMKLEENRRLRAIGRRFPLSKL
jgi:rRNA maturation RNase YbeY